MSISQMGKLRPREGVGISPTEALQKVRGWEGQDVASAHLALTAPVCSAPACGPTCSVCPTTTTSPRGQTSVSPTSRTRTAARATTTASSRRRGSSRPGPNCTGSPSPTPPGPRPPCLCGSYEGHRRSGSLPSCLTQGHLLANQGWSECLLAGQALKRVHPPAIQDLEESLGQSRIWASMWLIGC